MEDIPASVTILYGYILRNLQIDSVAEALRLVPGMAVGMASGNEYRISYHGGNGLIPRRMLVLLDGVPIYRTGYAKVDWKTIGVSIDEIDKIEVIRSPNSAAYGANAFQAVVNIKTKPLIADPANQVKVLAGSFGDRFVQYRYTDSLSSNHRLGLIASRKYDPGYDKNFSGDERHDSSDIKMVKLKYDIDVDRDLFINAQMSLVSGSLFNEFADSNQLTFPDIDVSDVFSLMTVRKVNYSGEETVATLSHTQSSWNQSWGKDALRPTCGTVNQDFIDRKTKIEFQNSRYWGDRLKTSLGLGIDYKQFSSETYTNGDVSLTDGYLFSNNEYSSNNFTINIGFMVESVSLNDSLETSPRFSFNYHIDNINTLRFIYSSSYRAPDLLETKRDWNYTMRNLSTPVNGMDSALFYYNSSSPDSLQSERNISKEISYLTKIPSMGVSIDLKIFKESMSRLISEKLQFFDYKPTNNGFLENKGIEIELFRRRNWLMYGLSYAYLDSDTEDFYERSLYSRHLGSVYVAANLSNKKSVNFAFYGASGPSGFSYDRYDVGFKKSIGLMDGKEISLGGLARHIVNDSGFVVTESFSVQNIYDNSTQIFFVFSLDI
ncbi:MAG: TonB-dependent receptor plug domain-containing protein [Gammaproteobacteria bacterium]